MRPYAATWEGGPARPAAAVPGKTMRLASSAGWKPSATTTTNGPIWQPRKCISRGRASERTGDESREQFLVHRAGALVLSARPTFQEPVFCPPALCPTGGGVPRRKRFPNSRFAERAPYARARLAIPVVVF